MSKKIVQLNEEVIKSEIKELVRDSVEETLNELLETQAEKLTQAAGMSATNSTRATAAVTTLVTSPQPPEMLPLRCPSSKGFLLKLPLLSGIAAGRTVWKRPSLKCTWQVYPSVVQRTLQRHCGAAKSLSMISELNKKAYVHIEDWRNRPLQGGRFPYVYVDGIYLRRNWGGEIAVNEDGYREVLGAAEGMKEDKASWVSFFQWLRGRGLDGVKLIVGDKCMGMLEAVGEVFPEAKYQRCTVHFYRNVF